MNKKILLVFISLTLFGCDGLVSTLATCPRYLSQCVNQDMMQIVSSESGTQSTSTTFATLVKPQQGKLDTLTATVEDSFNNTATVKPANILKPNTHNNFDASAWFVRFDWGELSAAGIRVEPNSRTWTITLTGSQNGKTVTSSRKVLVAN